MKSKIKSGEFEMDREEFVGFLVRFVRNIFIMIGIPILVFLWVFALNWGPVLVGSLSILSIGLLFCGLWAYEDIRS